MTSTWFKDKMNELKDDPEYLKEYIELLQGEIEARDAEIERLRPKDYTATGSTGGYKP